VRRIGYLESGSAAPGTPNVEAFRKGLRDLGWVEGQNIAIEVRYAAGKFDRLPTLAAELVRLKVELIFASTTPGALAAKRATTTIPIVIGFVADPVKSGLVATSRNASMPIRKNGRSLEPRGGHERRDQQAAAESSDEYPSIHLSAWP
jgi:hypothetical protein